MTREFDALEDFAGPGGWDEGAKMLAVDVVSESPKRIQRKRTKGWRMPEGAVYVGRLPNGLGGWGNPYVVSEHQTRQQAVDNFRRALVEGRLQYSVAKVHRELAGRDLACWCPLEDEYGNRVPCHADVLLELANWGGADV